MTQTFFPPQSDTAQKVYCYVNRFSKIVVAKLKGFENIDYERVIFPTQRFLFMANNSCDLEIHLSTDIGIVKDTIPCSKLEVTKS